MRHLVNIDLNLSLRHPNRLNDRLNLTIGNALLHDILKEVDELESSWLLLRLMQRLRQSNYPTSSMQ